MKPLIFFIFAIMMTISVMEVQSSDNQYYNNRNSYTNRGNRVGRQTNADQMVQNILQWLQGVYTQNSRKIRQGQIREYLPPSNTQRPRPFEPVNGGYPPAGSTPQPPFPLYTNPTTGGITAEGYPSPHNEITPPEQQPNYNGYPSGPSTSPSVTGYPTAGSTEGPGVSGTTTPQSEYTSPTGQPSSTGYPSEKPGFPTIQPSGLPTAPPSGFPTSSPSGFSTQPPSGPSTIPPAGFTTTTTSAPQSEGQPSTSPPQTNEEPITSGPISTEGAPLTNPPGTTPSSQTYNPEHFTSAEATTSEKPAEVPAGETTEAPSKPSPGENEVVPTARDSGEVETEVNEDLNHPPHIHKIDVQCAKDMMTINIEFNRQFDGVIYSKGFYNMPECRYVNEKSGQKEYSINLKLDTCGTKFINAFDTEGQSYLENVLVLQNEPGIQEVWDTVRAVRCLWEGNLKETLSVALSVGMLTQEIVTFSGDTAMAKLDVQLGRGPFGEPADGLVKIGEPMTLVVSVTGDPGFDLQVKDCRATDSTGENVVPLTDNDGCVLKPKLFGAFQKTRSTGDTGASIIAYAYFNAFKFPDVMDLMIECNIELCKTDCEMCPNPDQKLEPGRRRRRRDLYTYNQTLADGITMGKHLRIILPEDLTDGDTIVNLSQTQGVCMSTQSFVFSSALLISILTFSCLFSAYMWLKNQRLNIKM